MGFRETRQSRERELHVELKPGAQAARINQYPIRLEACKGLEPLINTAMQYGLLGEYQSELNTPILSVKKPHSQEYGLEQQLRAMNKITMNIYTCTHTPPYHSLHFDSFSSRNKCLFYWFGV